MYYTVVEARDGKNPRRYVYTGLCGDKKDGLLEQAIESYPQYKNLKVIKMDGENPNNKKSGGFYYV